MCGIAGFLSDSIGPEAAVHAAAMTRTLAHRGPDREGVWIDPSAGIALGHRRLAVVDLSPAGDQPMFSASGRYVIVFNGEIYNFCDLRREAGGGGFRGHSDTEVMLACFERWGVAGSLPRFNGMFAFAVWDRLEQELHLARDPIGEKPLYYGRFGGTLLFGSELKALRAHPDFPGEIDRNVVARFLKYGYVPVPWSIYKDVFKLEPGCVLTFRSGSARTERYWSLKNVVERGCAAPFRGSEQEAERQLESLLLSAVKMRMIADVPLGAFLSGGLDSSLVVALMQRSSEKPVRTFTIGFHEAAYNEAAAAEAVARRLGTDHTEWYVTPAEARSVVPRLPELYDEPFADSSQIPTFLVAQLARRHVTVSLSGDGGDELFGGYSRYARVARLRQRMKRTPGALRRLGSRALKNAPDYWLRRFAEMAPADDPIAFYDAYLAKWPFAAALVRGVEAAGPDDRPWARCRDFYPQMMAVDAADYLPDDILVKVDRATMGVSLESRIPLLDPRVIEFAWTLPHSFKVRGGQSKRIVRNLLHRYVPAELVERPKSGFAVPIGEWIRGPLRDWAEHLLDAKRIEEEGFLESELIRRRWREHLTGRVDHSSALWCVLMFEAWLEQESGGRSCLRGDVALAPAAC